MKRVTGPWTGLERYLELRADRAREEEALLLRDRYADFWAQRLWEVYEDDGKAELALRSEAGEG